MSPSLAPSLDATPTSASRRLPASSRRWQSGQRRGACNDFAWTDVGVESSAFHDGGPIEEAPCISSRRPSCKQSGKSKMFVVAACAIHSHFIQTSD
uniref:Uncharacterized protein n=1 Tax=Oryza meridionalis TaxID=40149 RepID=A0A0E0C2C2_9ORYZ